jgi:hypothetical protein
MTWCDGFDEEVERLELESESMRLRRGASVLWGWVTSDGGGKSQTVRVAHLRAQLVHTGRLSSH